MIKQTLRQNSQDGTILNITFGKGNNPARYNNCKHIYQTFGAPDSYFKPVLYNIKRHIDPNTVMVSDFNIALSPIESSLTFLQSTKKFKSEFHIIKWI